VRVAFRSLLTAVVRGAGFLIVSSRDRGCELP
jgi:hypothetical protein